MAFREPLDRRLVHAARRLAALPSAEAWRRLRPVAARLGVRWPSYQTVRRLLAVEREVRRLRRARDAASARLWTDLQAGRVPWDWLNHRIIRRLEPG
jgi:hypothetical protein